MEAPLTPRLIRLETARYIVRTLEPADATPSWGTWLSDPATAHNLNARPAALSAEAIRAYIESFDRKSAHLLGIFEKEPTRLIGIRSIYIDWKRGEFTVNVLVGEREARNKGVRSETRHVMYRCFFEDMGLTTARCSVVSTNSAMLDVTKRNGWIRENTSRKLDANGQGFVELHHLRLPRDVWRQKESEGAQEPAD